MSSSDFHRVRQASRQHQFLDVVSRDTAMDRFLSAMQLAPLGKETLPLSEALNRVLACDVCADVDVPGFDRSNVDGFAVQSADTTGAMEESPRFLKLNEEVLEPGEVPRVEVTAGTATPIATGGMIPRGADAVVMIEQTDLVEGEEPTIEVRSAVSPGKFISFAGTDIARGETVLRTGQLLTSREIGVLAAVGCSKVTVFQRPRVAVLSTGNEVISPESEMEPGKVFDSNSAVISAAVEELGGEAVTLGIIRDDFDKLESAVSSALEYDMVLLSGGTSKGAGDMSYQVVAKFDDPGIVAHGVALKPGKPICLAVTGGKPVVVLPGFPTSAIFTFHEFVAPVIRALAGRAETTRATVSARLPVRVNSEKGRTEFLLVGLVHAEDGLAAYPMGKGSGSVTTFSCADGFIVIGQHTEIFEADSELTVQLLGNNLQIADLVVIGSHCVGLDVLLGAVHEKGLHTKALYVGSMGGLAAAKRGECDVAGVHLLDEASGEYNRPFLSDDLELVRGYRRLQGVLYRKGDSGFEGKSISEAIAMAVNSKSCTMVNRNLGSGTRILIDQLLDGGQPAGYSVQTRSHNAVAAAISQGRADWGLAIESVAGQYGLGFIPYREEHYDFVVPKGRRERPAVQQFLASLTDPVVLGRIEALGFKRD